MVRFVALLLAVLVAVPTVAQARYPRSFSRQHRTATGVHSSAIRFHLPVRTR